jgi:indolepyruvate ferredoxin oxidoreductase, beta subunit
MSENGVTNVLIVGVGGQGIILASDVLSKAAAKAGLDVKKNEIHGMAQRGGSVSSHVRFGKEVNSPIIKTGEADVLASFELMETVRYWPFMSESGKLIVNDHKILPPAVFTGQQPYPEGIVDQLKERIPDAVIVNGIDVVTKIGNPRVLNVVFLGIMSKYLSIPPETYEEVLKESLKPKLVDINLQAFNEGRALAG